MDFFENQDRARRKTGLLVFYYCLAVSAIILSVYVVFVYIFTRVNPKTGWSFNAFWQPELFFYVTGITLLIVLTGTLYKLNQLSAGGRIVAELLGGRKVPPNTQIPEEKKLLNVVAEMALASGVSIPQVFVMDNEPGINAFAAGFSPNDAVVGVTRGCILILSRDELQGVIAHEFSHILNGDMRLNIRLIGVLHGILVLAFIGRVLMRTSSRRSSSRSKGGNPLPLFGFGLLAIGYIGVFFGNLIKSAISRQREYLADASAVQFTRNPSGLAGALKKIGGFISGSKIQSPNAQEASHLFFSAGLGSFLDLFATHPPLAERIQKLDPAFRGNFISADLPGSPALRDKPAAAIAGEGTRENSEEIISSIGAPAPEHLFFASRLLAGLPPEIIKAAREPGEAVSLIYALLLNEEGSERELQLKRLSADGTAYKKVLEIIPLAGQLSGEEHLPVLDLAVASLKGMPEKEYVKFREDIGFLIEADGKVSLFEFVLQKMLLRKLEQDSRPGRKGAVKYYDILLLLSHCEVLLSSLAHQGSTELKEKLKAFGPAAAALEGGTMLKFLEEDKCSLPALDKALDELSHSAPKIKKQLVRACLACIAADGKITAGEAELFRAVTDALDCPVPPVFPGPAVPAG